MRRLGNYELLKKIGSGGMAEVWMGRRSGVGGVTKAVAIKMLARSLANQNHYRSMFVDEARLSMLLSHSNIVQVFDVGQEGETSYLVMEWVDGLNLAQIAELLRRSAATMPLPVTAYVIGELLHALAYAHTLTHEGKPLGIVHRDVSPQNVLISVSGEVKLTDFGVARLASDDTSGLHIKGKLRYMAPEQLAGDSKRGGVDLYAVGSVLHELLDGRRFRGDGVDDAYLYAQVTGGVVPELSNDQVPPELDVLRRALLEPDPARRLSTASDALAVLEAWPGYRNASIELGKMCRWFMGVQAPRSGLQERVESLPSVEVPIVVSGETTRTADLESDLDSGANTLVAARVRPWTRRLLPALIGVGGLSVMGGLVWWQTEPAGAPTPPASSSGGERSQADLVVTHRPIVSQDEPKVGAAESPEGDDDLEVASDADSAVDPSARSRRRGRLRRFGNAERAGPESKRSDSKAVADADAPASVTLGLAGLRLAFIRIDGKSVHVLQPTAEAELSPGRHRIEWRLTEDEPWQAARPIRVRSGRGYVLRVGAEGPRLSTTDR